MVFNIFEQLTLRSYVLFTDTYCTNVPYYRSMSMVDEPMSRDDKDY